MGQATGFSTAIFCFQGLKPPAAGSVDTYVKANLLPGASKVRVRARPSHSSSSLGYPLILPHPTLRTKSQLLGSKSQGRRPGGQLTCLPDPRPASFGHALFEAPGNLSGKRHSPIMVLRARMLDGRP